MNVLRSIGVLITLFSAIFLTSCSSSYHSSTKPSKDGEVIVVGAQLYHLVPFARVQPRAWAINVKTGEKEKLKVEFE